MHWNRICTCLLAALLALGAAACQRADTPSPEPNPIVGPVILVTGATGTQGGAVARELLQRGYLVRALTRDPDQPEALRLHALGAEVVAGNYNDLASLRAAMEGAHGVFAVTVREQGVEREVSQGRALIEAAQASDIEHFVFTSVAGADDAPGIGHFASKYAIEQLLADSNLTWTVVRPVEFMDNWRYIVDDLHAGRYVNPRNPQESHQWIAAADIGYFVAEAFDGPGAWAGRIHEIAGDEMTLGELVSVMSDVFGREIEYVQVSWSEFEQALGPELATMYRWFADEGYDVDVERLRNAHPGLTTVREYLADLAAARATGVAGGAATNQDEGRR